MSEATGTADAVPIAEGSCHCGAVRFRARSPSRFACHCHCESCRRSHSAGFVTWIGYPSAQVTVTAGAETLASYPSSPGTERKFCRICGSHLFFESARWAGETHVAYAALRTPADRLPSGDAFYEEHAAWLPRPAGGPDA